MRVTKTKFKNGEQECQSISLELDPCSNCSMLNRRETNLDDVLQISNVFVNVSKGEVAKAGDLQKAFNTTEISEIVKEVILS